MINRPGMLANRVPFPAAELPDLSPVGLDATVAAASVERAGGSRVLFARALAAGLAAHPAARTDRDALFALVAIAAWRSGALALRVDALTRLHGATDAERRRGAAATLGIAEDVLDEFLRRQQADRFWWPERDAHRGYVLAVGGFRGVGGAWIRPPERGIRLAGEGAFAFLVAGEWWRLDCDVWGAHLAPLSDAPAPADDPDDGVGLVFGEGSHLAWVRVQDPA